MKQFSDFQMFMLEKGEFTCKDTEKLYGDYFDNELPPSLRGRLDAHIEECDECREFVSQYNRTVNLAKELANTPISKDIQNRLRARLNERLGINLPPAQ